MGRNITMQNIDYFETICINCPGSLWGEKSICRIHNKSIGDITTCEQWTRHPLKIDNGQLTFTDLEPAIEIIQKTEEDLRSYHWMIKEIDRLHRSLSKASGVMIQNKLTAQWGIDATLPKGKGDIPSHQIMSDKRFERQVNRLRKLEEKVDKIDYAVNKYPDGVEKTVLECILDNERMNMIAIHVGVSRQKLNEIKRLIVKKMAWTLYEDELKR